MSARGLRLILDMTIPLLLFGLSANNVVDEISRDSLRLERAFVRTIHSSKGHT